MKNSFLGFLAFWLYVSVTAQTIDIQARGTKTSLRGLSVVDNQIVWVSGSNGTVARSTDGGKTWQWMTVAGYEKRDFRDIEAFDAQTAIIIGIAEPAVILKTTDGGEHWKLVYENTAPGMFLDAMEFRNETHGIVIGDPIHGRFFMAQTTDAGNSWQELPAPKQAVADSGEACFASSGTNIKLLTSGESCFVSGGLSSHLFWNATPGPLPIVQGKETTGAHAVAIQNPHQRKERTYLVVVGGNFNADSVSIQNCFLSKDGGHTWIAPATPPRGFKSCVEFIRPTQLIACGTSGVDVSADTGMHWKYISTESFHVCRKAKKGSAVYLAGSNGKIGKLTWTDKTQP